MKLLRTTFSCAAILLLCSQAHAMTKYKAIKIVPGNENKLPSNISVRYMKPFEKISVLINELKTTTPQNEQKNTRYQPYAKKDRRQTSQTQLKELLIEHWWTFSSEQRSKIYADCLEIFGKDIFTKPKSDFCKRLMDKKDSKTMLDSPATKQGIKNLLALKEHHQD
ncbi:MAG: hypothetical protein H6679_01370 [Epsilonproteobacteria bacterium]|nr:hypothetical protein [Campylobacterota bacterium]